MITCPVCEKQFEPTSKQRWNIKNRPQCAVHCTASCARIGQKRKMLKSSPIGTCNHCGKEFVLSKDQRGKVRAGKRVGCTPLCGQKLCGNRTLGRRAWLHDVGATHYWNSKKLPAKPDISPWIPFSGVGASDFPGLMNPF